MLSCISSFLLLVAHPRWTIKGPGNRFHTKPSFCHPFLLWWWYNYSLFFNINFYIWLHQMGTLLGALFCPSPTSHDLDYFSYKSWNLEDWFLLLSFFFFLDLFIYLICFWLWWAFVAACRLSLVATSGGYSLLRCTGFSFQWLLLLRSTGSRCLGFSSCSPWARKLWCTGLVAPHRVESPRTRDWTSVPCIAKADS